MVAGQKPAPKQTGTSRSLKALRERRGMSQRDVSDALHMPVRHIKALEEKDFSAFAAEVYARGAYEKYAAFMGVPNIQAQREALRVAAPSRQKRELRLLTPATFFQRMVTPRVILGLGIAAMAAAVGGYIVFQLQSFWDLPTLVIHEPMSDVVDASSISLRGVSEPKARVTVNDELVLLKDDATFEVELSLQPGINIVEVKARNIAGRTRVVQRALLVPRNNGYDERDDPTM